MAAARFVQPTRAGTRLDGTIGAQEQPGRGAATRALWRPAVLAAAIRCHTEGATLAYHRSEPGAWRDHAR